MQYDSDILAIQSLYVEVDNPRYGPSSESPEIDSSSSFRIARDRGIESSELAAFATMLGSTVGRPSSSGGGCWSFFLARRVDVGVLLEVLP